MCSIAVASAPLLFVRLFQILDAQLAAPGNVLLETGEADLPEQGVVNVFQILTVSKTQLGEKIGTLLAERVRQIVDGVRLLTEPREAE